MADEPDIAPPCVRHVPAEIYHKSPGVSKSNLDLIHICPALLEWSRNAPVDEEAKAAVDTGRAFHTLLLEPERFALEYVADWKAPDNAITTVGGLQEALDKLGIGYKSADNKAALTKKLLDANPSAPVSDAMEAEWRKGINGRIVLSRADSRKLELMRGSVMAHPSARKLVEMDGQIESCHYWLDPLTGELCRSRPDKTIAAHGIIADVKTAADASERGFARSLHDWRYYVQDAFYCDGYKHAIGEACKTFLFLVVSTSREGGRYPVHVLELPEEQRDMGRDAYKADLATYSQCRKSGKWPGIEMASLPSWFLGQQLGEIS